MQHTMIALVENKPGVLNRVASLFRRRNFNIESLNVGRTERSDVSRMTIVIDSQVDNARRVETNLYKLVNVIDVQDLTNQPTVSRDLALIKVHASPDRRGEVANLASIFRGRIVDVAEDSVIVEVTGTEDKIEGLTHWASRRWYAPVKWQCYAEIHRECAIHLALMDTWRIEKWLTYITKMTLIHLGY